MTYKHNYTPEYLKKRLNVWKKHEKHCAYCGELTKFRKMTIDHLLPKLYKNSPFMKNKIEKEENLFCACKTCNEFKGGDELNTFRQKILALNNLKYIPSVIEVKIISKYIPFKGKFYFEQLKKN